MSSTSEYTPLFTGWADKTTSNWTINCNPNPNSESIINFTGGYITLYSYPYTQLTSSNNGGGNIYAPTVEKYNILTKWNTGVNSYYPTTTKVTIPDSDIVTYNSSGAFIAFVYDGEATAVHNSGVDTSQYFQNGYNGNYVGYDSITGNYDIIGIHNRKNPFNGSVNVSTGSFSGTGACKISIDITGSYSGYIYPALICNSKYIYVIYYSDVNNTEYAILSNIITFDDNILVGGFTCIDNSVYVSVYDSIGILSSDGYTYYYYYIIKYILSASGLTLSTLTFSLTHSINFIGYIYNSSNYYIFPNMSNMTSCKCIDNSIKFIFTDINGSYLYSFTEP